MVVTLTDAAASQIQNQVAKRAGAIGLRVGVKRVGCSGLAYTYELADTLQPGDHVFQHLGATLVVDTTCFGSIDGASLDYVTEGMKKTFQFDNPNVRNTCGCGESFALKGA